MGNLLVQHSIFISFCSSVCSSDGVLVKVRPKSQAKSLSCTVIGISFSEKKLKVDITGFLACKEALGIPARLLSNLEDPLLYDVDLLCSLT